MVTEIRTVGGVGNGNNEIVQEFWTDVFPISMGWGPRAARTCDAQGHGPHWRYMISIRFQAKWFHPCVTAVGRVDSVPGQSLQALLVGGTWD